VALEAATGQTTLNERASACGVHPVQMAQWKRQLLDASTGIVESGSPSRREREQEQWVERLSQAALASDRPAEGGSGLAAKTWERRLVERRALLAPTQPQLSIARHCARVGLARSRWYDVPCGESEEKLCLMRLLDEHCTKTPFSGVARMTAWRRQQGDAVTPKRVRRLVRRMGLEALPTAGPARWVYDARDGTPECAMAIGFC